MVKMSMTMNPDDEASQPPTESDELAVRESEIASLPGVIAELGKLGAGAVVTEQGLAQLFNRCTVSVKRAVIRGELPPPCRLFGSNAWTVGALVGHIERRLGEAAAKSQKLANKIRQLNP
jgi:hypothetical protein